MANIWCWPCGSGEVYGYRNGSEHAASVRAGVLPKLNADNNIGEWNTFEITVRGNRLTVVNNGHTVIENAELPGLPETGPVGLATSRQQKERRWTSPPALVQFRNISIKELTE